MMAAAQALSSSNDTIQITLFEKNWSLWSKVIISGGWRCNVTTGYYKRKDLESKYIRWASWLRKVIWLFGPRKIYQWFEAHGVSLKTESDMRVFPVSNNGRDIVKVFDNIFSLSKKEFKLSLNSSIQSIIQRSHGFELHADWSVLFFDAVIIATGGQAYQKTWSTGDAYGWASSLWHNITTLWPSLNSFLTENKRMHELSGISFPNAKISVNWKNLAWSLLVTHFWISGPLAFVVAAHTAFEKMEKSLPLLLSLSVDASIDVFAWNQRLLQWSKDSPRKQIDTILKTYLPHRFVDSFLKEFFPGQYSISIGQISKYMRTEISKLLGWGIQIGLIGRRPGDEFVTAWGIELSEVDSMTMMSKLVSGLFFAWEVLDIDGVTGWYNLTSSWSTGNLAWLSAVRYLLLNYSTSTI